MEKTLRQRVNEVYARLALCYTLSDTDYFYLKEAIDEIIAYAQTRDEREQAERAAS